MPKVIKKLKTLKQRLETLNHSNASKVKSTRKYADYCKYYGSKTALVSVGLLTSACSLLYGGVAIQITGGNWDTGTRPSGDSVGTATNNWQVQGSADGTTDIVANVSNSNNWQPIDSDSPAVNRFVLKENVSGTRLINSDRTLKTKLYRNQWYAFGLWYASPTTGSQPGSHTLTVTLTATNWRAWCLGWNHGGYCFYRGHHGWSCNDVCSSHNGCNWHGIWHYTFQCHHGGCGGCHVCYHWYSSGHHCYFHYVGHGHHAMSFCHAHNWCMFHSRSHGHHEHCERHEHWLYRFCTCNE
jgi:hypothetical protein